MSAEAQVRRLLDAHDFALVRQRKHNVYRNPAGITFVRPHTGSDSRRGDRNSLADLKRVLRGHGLPITPAPEMRATRPEPVGEKELLQALETFSVPKPDVTPAASQLCTAVHNSCSTATPAPTPAPLTKAEQKKLARWERNYAAKEARQERTLAFVSELAELCADMFEFGAPEPVIASKAAEFARRHGYRSELLLVSAQMTRHDGHERAAHAVYLVGVNGYHFDIRCGAIWKPGRAFAGPHKFKDCVVEFTDRKEL